MKEQDFTTSFKVDQTPQQVYDAIIHPQLWWSEEITGSADNVNDVFDYHFEDVHFCKVKIEELTPGKKVVWRILENNFNFTRDKTEWVNTKVVFDVNTKGNQTEMTLTHYGLVPEYECYDACYQGWTFYMQTSLKNLISTGVGSPNKSGAPQTETEAKLSTGE
ncbi:SRPBCC domain-containing protein [Mucilaginibacter calamicampi]|uniref:SRPBCC domain-containing protein n=1 Tax=Mucilaginibacter calamicampi TaxID=1302352 RepID=A0ABW2YV50_9SPHI